MAHRGRVQQAGGAEQGDGSISEEVVQGRQEPVEERPRMVPAVPGVGADQRGVPAHVLHPEGEHGPVAGGVPQLVERSVGGSEDGPCHHRDHESDEEQAERRARIALRAPPGGAA